LIVSSKNVKDKYFILHNDEIIRVNKIIKYFNGEIKIEIIKLNYSSFFDNPISSVIIKMFNVINTILEPHPQLINFNLLTHKCFTVPLDDSKFIAIALLHVE
jgi:hypothetical protein